MLKIKVLVFFLLSFSSSFAITMQEAVQETLKDSNEIIKINADLSSVNANKASNFEATYLPEFYLTYDKLNGSPDTGNSFNQEEKKFVASYNLSNIYKGSLSFISQNNNLNAKKFNSEQESNNLIIKTITAYLKVLETEKSIDLLSKSLALNQKMLEQITEKARVGSTKRSAVLLAQSQTEEIMAKLELAKSELIIDKNRFFQIVGKPAEELLEPNFPNLEFTKLEDFLEKVEKNNLTLKVSESLKTSSKYDLARTSSDFLPDITISYNKYKIENNLLPNVTDSGSRVTLTAKLYLYKPGLISSVIQKGYDYRSSKNQHFINFKQIETSARDLWSKYEYYNTILASKERLVQVRNNLLKDYQEDYRYGRVELTETLEEERKLTEAELDLLKAKFQKMLNIFEIKSLAGEKII